MTESNTDPLSSVAEHVPSAIGSSGFGFDFERNVQTAFVVLMLAKGYSPGLQVWPINRIYCQARRHGFKTDDIVVFAKDGPVGAEARLFASIKLTASVDEAKDSPFGKTMRDAWEMFKKGKINDGLDAQALITGPISEEDNEHARWVLDNARAHTDSTLFFESIEQEKGIDKKKHDKLKAFVHQMTHWNGGVAPSREDQWKFLKHFYLFGFDLDIRNGVVLAIMHSVLGTMTEERVSHVWRAIKDEITWRSKHAGDITVDGLPKEIQAFFGRKEPPRPSQLNVPKDRLMITAFLLGQWNEKAPGDQSVIERLSGFSFLEWQRRIVDLRRQRPDLIDNKNGLWTVLDRDGLMKHLGGALQDKDVEDYVELVLEVLTPSS